jgi:hypothetical protein
MLEVLANSTTVSSVRLEALNSVHQHIYIDMCRRERMCGVGVRGHKLPWVYGGFADYTIARNSLNRDLWYGLLPATSRMVMRWESTTSFSPFYQSVLYLASSCVYVCVFPSRILSLLHSILSQPHVKMRSLLGFLWNLGSASCYVGKPPGGDIAWSRPWRWCHTFFGPIGFS